MNTDPLHLTVLFEQYAGLQQNRLRHGNMKRRGTENELLDQLLCKYQQDSEMNVLRQALVDPYFPLGMLSQTLFADVVGMRFFINKRRPDLERGLTSEFAEWAAAFVRIRRDIQALFDPETITCIPINGIRHRLPSGQWCNLCGVCCQIGGVPPEPPPGILYPPHWYGFLAGETVANQQLCPFLFQHFGEPHFFCAIHHIKPIACRQFGLEDCRQRLEDGGLHDSRYNPICP
jgi:hypothetical protein